MTDSQAKLIAFIRQRGGEVRGIDIPTYRHRSVDPMVRAGLLKAIACGECLGCKCSMWDYRVEYWHCHDLRIRYDG
jgi:hypothetical protein